ncbi:MAG: endolytic transglycosylase MltG [Bacteroidia bacterium]|nr:endolytic transglycosylase MltG [Bacteroidia bacterium]
MENKKRNLLILVFVVITVLGLKVYSDLFSQNVFLKNGSNEIAIFVDKQKRIESVIFQLKQQKVLKNSASFERLVKWVQLEKKLKMGRYSIRDGMNNADIIKLLYKGRQQAFDIVFKYAERPQEISLFFSKNLMADSFELNSLFEDEQFLNRMGFNHQTITAMFIPNTYNFYWNTSASEVFERMYKEYNSFWNKEREARAQQVGLSKVDVSILASIVQKESNKVDEMPIIAGVYLNRMKLGMPLQADPTIIFAWNDKSIKRVTSLHTAIESPYNTYTQLGLPPGPICTPSEQAIEAVLNYGKHKYLYFCAKEDFSGYHTFANSFEQHLQNASRYQRALNKRNIH